MKKIRFVIMIMILITFIGGCSKSSDKNNAVSQESFNVNIIVNYKEKFGGDNDDYYICIDDQRIEKISCGDKASYNVKLSSGKHKFHMESEVMHKSDEIEFDVSKNEESFKFNAEGSLLAGVNVSKG